MARHRGEALSSLAGDTAVPATSFDYYLDVDFVSDWDLANLNAVGEPLKHNVLKTMLTKLQEKCLCADVAVPSSIIDVIFLALGVIRLPLPAMFLLVILCVVMPRCPRYIRSTIAMWRS